METGAGLGPARVLQVAMEPSACAVSSCLPSEFHDTERSAGDCGCSPLPSWKRESAAFVFRSHRTTSPDSKPISSYSQINTAHPIREIPKEKSISTYLNWNAARHPQTRTHFRLIHLFSRRHPLISLIGLLCCVRVRHGFSEIPLLRRLSLI